MEIFYNQERSGYEEIVSYGPSWWTEYRELDANYRFAGWTLDLMAHFLEQEVKNQFPSQADEKTIKMFERLLRIEYDSELTLEERRRVVSAYYSGTGHLSRSVILSLVKAYTGHEGEVYWHGPVLRICFSNDSNNLVSIGLLQKILERRMPAHIPYQTCCTCSVGLKLHTKRKSWKMLFVQSGTEPMVSAGLAIGMSDIELKATPGVYRNTYPLTGQIKATGTFPGISTGLILSHEEMLLQAEIEALSVQYEQTGKDLSAGTVPGVSLGYEETENSVAPEVRTENWTVSYQLCGDSFEI